MRYRSKYNLLNKTLVRLVEIVTQSVNKSTEIERTNCSK